MNKSKDLIEIKYMGSQLYIMDCGHLGIKFILLRADGQWFSTACAPYELTSLIDKLTEFRDRNVEEGVK